MSDNMFGDILVLATTFLKPIGDNPEGVGKPVLDKLVEDSGRRIKVIYRCNRDPSQRLTPEEVGNARVIIADLEPYDVKLKEGEKPLLPIVGVGNNGSLELIIRYGAGTQSVNIEAADANGIDVANCPGCNAESTAEFTDTMIHALASRLILQYHLGIHGMKKDDVPRMHLSDKKLAVVGTGHVGRLVVETMKKLYPDMQFMAYDKFPIHVWAKEHGVEYIAADKDSDKIPERLLREADIISLHPAYEKQMIGAPEISIMKPNAILVNCARWILVDFDAAYAAVKEGKLWGYGCDDTHTHPTENPLNLRHNVILTPHKASDAIPGMEGMQRMSVETADAFLRGKDLNYLVN